MSLLRNLTGITTPASTDLFYVVQNNTDYKMTSEQFMNFAKSAIVVSLTQAQYDALTPAEKSNGSIYLINDATLSASDIAYGQGTVEDSLDELSNIGNLQRASWTGSSSSAYGTNLTGAITLTKGIYIVTIKTPVSDTTPLLDLHDNTNDRTYYYVNIPSQESFTIPIEITATTDIIVRSAASSTTNYSYLDRGGLFAVKIR